MSKVIINADDFGYSRGINHGIIDSHAYGILTSTTMMANMPGFDHGVSLAKDHPKLGIGVHLTLTCGKPLLSNVSSLTDNGSFHKLSFYNKGEFDINSDELYREWDAQVQKILDAGIKPTHIDGHHHIQTFGNNKNVALKLAGKYKLAVRHNPANNWSLDIDGKAVDVKYPAVFEPYIDDIGREPAKQRITVPVDVYLEQLLERLRKNSSTEVMCHPAYIDELLHTNSATTTPRIFMTEFLISSTFADAVRADKEIELVTFADI